MFIHCRRTPTLVTARFTSAAFALTLCLALAALVGCSKQQSTPQEDWSPGAKDAVKANVTAGGVPTRYEAHFEDNELQRIIETRSSGSRQDCGEYTFKGARLIEYRGTTIDGRTQAGLTFNLQGVLTNNRGDLTPEEIAAIANRAQLLRSLALSRKASQGHGG